METVERRAHFLSKVNDPSRTVTTSILEAPPLVHCSIPPRNFESELSILEGAENSEDLTIVDPPTNPGWSKLVGHGLLTAEQPLESPKFPPAMPKRSRCIPPSLNEITARLKLVHVSFERDCSRSRLPNFLKASSVSLGSTDDRIKTVSVRSLALNGARFNTTFAQQVICPRHPDPCTLTTVIPHTVDFMAGPTLHVSRADTARDMIATLKRRISPPVGPGRHECTWASTKVKRCSAPAELQHSGRVGFECAEVSRGVF